MEFAYDPLPRYYEEKGFEVILVSRVLNLLALAFTIAFSAFLLLFVKWHALRSECILKDTCDISEVVFDPHPLKDGFTVWNTLRVMYVAIFAVYWLYNLAHLFVDLREAAVISHFTRHRLGLSARQLKTVTWPEVARRIVDVQKQTRLCITRDLTEKDVVSRIMRKENYLIGMLNKGVLALNVTIPGLGKRFMLTKTLEWNLHWCILDAMLDDNFCIKEDFKHDAPKLQRRFRRVAVANLLLAPFLLMFLLIYFFMRNAEKFYHQPSSAGARRWSSLAAWRLREFNELPHYLNHRLNASHKAAEKYIQQFPSPVLSHMAKFVAFLAGSFAALLLFMALVDDTLLERHLFGRNLVWWAATLGIVLAVSRAFIAEAGVAFEPELALLEVVAHTHWLPRHWRGRAHTQEVQQQFQELFQFKALLFLEEMASIVLTPFVLYFSLPKCAPAILAFVRDFSVHVPGVGDICSLGAFDFERHGNSKYGSPSQAPKAARSRQGKMEKSFLSFAATYPTWEPDSAAKQMLLSLGQAPPLRNGLNASETDYQPMHSAIAASLFPGAPRYPAYHNISPYSVAAASSVHRLALRTAPGAASMQNSIFGSAEITAGAASAAGR
ncbi:APG9-domain-containing protein [Coccomyxa subellipsoidea C-169]|uniref:Autophagy-related protein 9 n=1 Tax=Coccomyxa subellipsoidea (strain C-169) TaxID=574566 RepID=I0YPH9_COCSC|nr:APG9-domain-containing protein [Coccomyxa subellipsoidea C-169]EIE20298.1 APG9-domain-containing protein [Coccomyxa subellipsoidea C-169]|eukprot:XP_005644842.1 APG9-domain-containing protein [Coccomyxa subellipsoidea C-169]